MGEIYGQDVDSAPFWEREAETYKEQLDGSRAVYHEGRLTTARTLIQQTGKGAVGRVIDFGCGEGVLARWLVAEGYDVHGMDIAEEMVRMATVAVPEGATFVVADAHALGEQGACDGLVALNVLAYLTETEHEAFWAGARRVLPGGGWLMQSHSNELFDLFALNAGTDSFFRRHLTDGRSVAGLLTAAGTDNVSYNIRANPLTYPDELRARGFEEVGRAFFNFHPVPPGMLGPPDDGRIVDPAQIAKLPEWRQLLQCSTYFSIATRLPG